VDKVERPEIEPWTRPGVTISSFAAAHDDESATFVELPLDTPESAVAPYVEQAIRELFLKFGGYRMPSQAIEHWVRRLIERKL
jgi:hypothetical protein